MHIQLCSPQITIVYPACPLTSFCNSLLRALFSVHVHLGDKWNKTTVPRVPSKEAFFFFFRSGCDHKDTKLDQPANWKHGVGTRDRADCLSKAMEGAGCWGKRGSKWAPGEAVVFGIGGWAWLCLQETMGDIKGPVSGQNDCLNPVTGRIHTTYIHAWMCLPLADMLLDHPRKSISTVGACITTVFSVLMWQPTTYSYPWIHVCVCYWEYVLSLTTGWTWGHAYLN